MPMLLLFAPDFSKLLIGGLERGERRDARRREGDKVRENATDPKLQMSSICAELATVSRPEAAKFTKIHRIIRNIHRSKGIKTR